MLERNGMMFGLYGFNGMNGMMNEIYRLQKKKRLTPMNSSRYISARRNEVTGSKLSYSTGLYPFMKKKDFSSYEKSVLPISGVIKNTVYQHQRYVRSGGSTVPMKARVNK